jgi:hypothetical protein
MSMSLRLPQKTSCGEQCTPRSASCPLKTGTAALFWESNLRFRLLFKIGVIFVVLWFEDAESVPNKSVSTLNLSTSARLLSLPRITNRIAAPCRITVPVPSTGRLQRTNRTGSHHSQADTQLETAPHHLILQRSQPSHHSAIPDCDSLSDEGLHSAHKYLYATKPNR